MQSRPAAHKRRGLGAREIESVGGCLDDFVQVPLPAAIRCRLPESRGPRRLPGARVRGLSVLAARVRTPAGGIPGTSGLHADGRSPCQAGGVPALCEADEVVYFPNPTTAINMVAHSLSLGPGDEVLASDHEYGAMDRTWRFVCQQIEARYGRQPIPLPLTDAAEFVEHVWRGVRPQTRAIFLSHITSPTALRVRVEIICSRARAAGILTWVRSASCTPPISMVPKPSSVSSSAPGCSTKPIS